MSETTRPAGAEEARRDPVQTLARYAAPLFLLLLIIVFALLSPTVPARR